MSTTGCLTDFSLTEIFQFIEKGNRSGLLTIRVSPEYKATLPSAYYIWVERGCLVAAASRLDQQGLVSLIEQRQWVSKHIIARLDNFCPTDKPLGFCLRDQGALQADHLKQLLHSQVLELVFILCQLKSGQFKFEQNMPIPAREMTGLSVPIVVLKTLLEAIGCIQQVIDQLQSQSTNYAQQIIDQLQAQSKALQLSHYDNVYPTYTN